MANIIHQLQHRNAVRRLTTIAVGLACQNAALCLADLIFKAIDVKRASNFISLAAVRFYSHYFGALVIGKIDRRGVKIQGCLTFHLQADGMGGMCRSSAGVPKLQHAEIVRSILVEMHLGGESLRAVAHGHL